MTNEELNAKLYEKMFAEQEKYREKLLTMQPEEILEHAYEYAVREDILASLENNELEDSQARALLKYARPLSLVYKEYDNRVNEYMEDIWNTIESASESENTSPKGQKTTGTVEEAYHCFFLPFIV